MAVEDWTVAVTKISPVLNTKQNPYTGKPIDPSGLTLSVVEMTLTHGPTGKVLYRADQFSVLTAEEFRRYARGITENADTNIAAQADAALIGALDLAAPAPPEPSADQVAAQLFRDADAAYQSLKRFVDSGDLAADDAVLLKAKDARDAALAPVLDATKAAVDTKADAIGAAVAAVADVAEPVKP